ncbi:MAG: zinc ribbon domain-containing protein [Anaerolineae bacterium]|nr:zinc ribbon domain-containing protein [Anaerolineae bacterium]
MLNLGDAGGLFTGLVVYGGMVLAAFWLAMIIWTYRDMRARSRDSLAQIVVAVMVALLTLPGLLIYLFLRPRETLSEAYERSLEEEALLQEIEDKPVCPGCKQRVQDDWQACPNCHTRLKRSCTRCGRMLDLTWDLCPYCTTPVPSMASVDRPTHTHSRQPAPVIPAPDPWAPAPTYTAPSYSGRASRQSESLEFVENDDG